MSIFKCTDCSYETQKKTNLSRHFVSKKHIEKVTEKPNETYLVPICNIEQISVHTYNCNFCNNNYSTAASLARHKKACSVKTDILNNNISKEAELNNKIHELTEKLNSKDEVIANLKSEITNLRTIVNNAGSIVKTSVSSMSYVIKNYNNAPVLEPIKNMALLHSNQTMEQFVEKLISEYRRKTIVNFIGNLIIKLYKKEDPTKQSLWNSDTSRLTYLIRELLSNDSNDWMIDKKGIKTSTYVIEPVMDYISECLDDYIENYDTDYRLDSRNEAENKMMKLQHASNIQQMIINKILAEEILKYITPHLYLSRSENLLDLE